MKQPQTREEFETTAKAKLQDAVDEAKSIRKKLRTLENTVNKKKTEIANKSQALESLQEKLVQILAKVYAKGTN